MRIHVIGKDCSSPALLINNLVTGPTQLHWWTLGRPVEPHAVNTRMTPHSTTCMGTDEKVAFIQATYEQCMGEVKLN